MQPRLGVVLLLTQSPVATGAFFISLSPRTQLSLSNRNKHHRFAHNSNNNNNGAEVEGDLEYRSISDYVGGLHGGKYEFDTRISGVTSLNYEKSHVFDDTTRSSQKGLRSVLAPYEDGEHVPSWATRQIQKNHPILRTIDLNSDVPQTMVTIKNDELTWEPFFAAIECRWGDQETSVWSKDINVAPSNGTLAPRGGIDVYSDVWDLVVFRPNDIAAVGEEMPNVLYLVVRTELDAWVWKIHKK